MAEAVRVGDGHRRREEGEEWERERGKKPRQSHNIVIFIFFGFFSCLGRGGRCVAGSVTLQQGVPAGGRRRGRSRAGDTTPSSEPSAPSIYVGPFDGRFLHLIHLPLLTPRHVTSDDDTRDIRNDVEFQAIDVWCSPLCAGKQQRAQFRTTSPIVSVATKSTPSAVPGGRPPQAAVRHFLAFVAPARGCLTSSAREESSCSPTSASTHPHTIQSCTAAATDLSYRRCRWIESRSVLLLSRVTDLFCGHLTLVDTFLPKKSSPPNPAGVHNKSLDVCGEIIATVLPLELTCVRIPGRSLPAAVHPICSRCVRPGCFNA